MKKPIKIVLLSILCIVAVLMTTVAIYVSYVVLSYSRTEDSLTLRPVGSGNLSYARTNTEYTIVTQNLGFGAYTPNFTFFMDGGKESRAESAESVKNCISLGAKTVSDLNPDFIFFQEVDTNSTRSFHIDQRNMLNDCFPDMSSVFAENYHSAYLFYPLTEPHGKSNSGIITYSNIGITSSVRRSLPISQGFSKFLDLDRCYGVSRVPVENGKELVLFNVHLSAYGGDDEIRSAQMNMLFSNMQEEYERGNYCICGGDFNHDFTGDSVKKLNGGENTDFGWAQPFPEELLSQYTGIVRADIYDGGELRPTCRNCDIPYEEGNFTIIVDGFLVSKNVKITGLENIDTKFEYSDHNPVAMKFMLY